MADYNAPPEQELAVNAFEVWARIRGVDEPPELLMQFDITHEETQQEWRTQLRFDRRRAIEFAQLLHFVFEHEELPWPT